MKKPLFNNNQTINLKIFKLYFLNILDKLLQCLYATNITLTSTRFIL